MKAGGSQGHRQTVMKEQCDLQLAGPLTQEQRFTHQNVYCFTKFRNLSLSENTVAVFVRSDEDSCNIPILFEKNDSDLFK